MSESIGNYQAAPRGNDNSAQYVADDDGIAKAHLRTRLLVIGSMSAVLWTVIVLLVQFLVDLVS